MRIAVVLVALVPAPAFADEAPTLEVGKVRGGAVGAVVRTDGDGTVTWTFEVSTKQVTHQELVIPLAVPRGLAITALTMQLETAPEPLVSEVFDRQDGRTAYREIVDGEEAERRAVREEMIDPQRYQPADPALLEWVASTKTLDRLRLHVYPIIADEAATITIEARLGDSEDIDRNVSRERSLVARFPSPDAPDRPKYGRIARAPER